MVNGGTIFEKTWMKGGVVKARGKQREFVALFGEQEGPGRWSSVDSIILQIFWFFGLVV